MDQIDVFLSVGGTATDHQEAFVCAVEDRLRSEGIIPHTVGRNTFSSDAPLKAVKEVMDQCAGTIVIALERTYFPSGIDKRGGPQESPLSEIKLPTPWNHIEAAMAYGRNHPLMVIVEEGIKNEGLLEPGYDWYVQCIKLEHSALTSREFNGVLASWKEKMKRNKSNQLDRLDTPSGNQPAEMTIGELIGGLKPAQLWSVLGALAALLAGAFALGANLIGGS